MIRDSGFQAVFPLAIIAAATFLACSPEGNESSAPQETGTVAAAAPVSAQPPTMQELANATFSGLQDEPVQLVDGGWQGEPFVEGGASVPAVGLVRDFHLVGDVTGDGNEESVVLLWTSSGGSGTFDYLAVVGRSAAGVANLGTAMLGDRVQLRQGRLSEGTIEIDVVQAGAEDAACCPTQMATRVWEMGPDGLTEISSEITGTLSAADLQGPEWVLTDMAWDEPAPAEPEVTLVFEEDRVAGNAGCNGYFGGFEEDTEMPTNLSFGAMGATRKMCAEEIMRVEDRFFKQLNGVTHFGFLAGKLALSWQDDTSAGVMMFAPREP